MPAEAVFKFIFQIRGGFRLYLDGKAPALAALSTAIEALAAGFANHQISIFGVHDLKEISRREYEEVKIHRG